ncbi:hypothetical protein HYFRA_00001798 [Hymenoscyphus fraxineus]|uniref:FAD-binding domain-containing protein n=1 Tax=Hymenoscyphus fraxineus TaxID=746836 RepID=A0A9N9KKL1_9HELO|nr:hypothetical protein HYFRA_00001798 [Hymenoscyphus fraxineus]
MDSVTPHRCKVAIIGAGLAGLATAVAIGQSGHEVTVFEKSSELKEIGAGINVPSNATRLFNKWGILSNLEESSIKPIYAVMRSHQCHELSRTQLFPKFNDTYESPYLVTHRADLQRILATEATRLGSKLHFDAKITKIIFNRNAIKFANGSTEEFDVIFGADGEKSFCREQLLEREDPLEDSGFEIFRTTVKRGDVVQNPKLGNLVTVPSINLWIGPDAHAVSYPIKGGDLLNVVLTKAHGNEAPLHILPVPVEKAAIRTAFSGWGTDFHDLLAITTQWNKRTMMYAKECNTWIHPRNRFALIGDAAHSSPPYLAQGAAMAFEDAAVLGVFFARLTSKDQICDLVAIYDEIRKPRAMECRSRSRDLRHVFTYADGPEQAERDRRLMYEEPFEGSPNFLSDPVLQTWLFGYDAVRAGEEAWENFLGGGETALPQDWSSTTKLSGPST